MKQKFPQALCFLIALTLCFSLFALFPLGAASAKEYFIFDALQGAQGQIYPAEDQPITLSLDEGNVYSAKGLSLLSGDTNSLYVSLVNQSNATKIRVSYTYEIYGVPASESAEYALLAQSGDVQTFLLEAPHIGAVNAASELSVSFLGEGGLSGTVTLKAMFNLSSYVQEQQEEATLSRCHYNAEKGEIEIEGSLSYAATVRYEGETLALFALAEGEDLHLSGKTPVARTSISFNFSFRAQAQSSDELFARYVVAAITAKGERIPLCVPTYPSFDVAAVPREQGFKGIASAELGDMIDVTPDVGVVDVYLNRLVSTQSDGVLYAGEYDYYYFDQTYLAELDTQIQNLAGMGTHVYLRLLADGESTGLSFLDEAPDGVQYRLPVIRTRQARRDLFAFTDFLIARYAASNAISGLILGHAADLTEMYSYAAAAGLGEYTALYAATLNLVASTARRHIPSLQLMLPVSDRIFDESITALQQTDNHYAALLLPSLFRALQAQILAPQSFAVLLESGALCDRVGGENETVYGTDRVQTFLAMLQDVAKQSPYVQNEIFFSWQVPSDAAQVTLRADYLLKYAALYQNAAVGAFLLDLGQAAPHGDQRSALIHMAKYINTDRYDDFCAPALTAIGINGISDLYPAMQSASFRQRRIVSATLTPGSYANAHKVTGSYDFWDFSTATDTLGWYAGNACGALSVLAGEDGAHALHGVCSTNGDYADISYHFALPVDLSFAPLWQAVIAVSGTPGTRYELQIRLIGDQSVSYASAIVSAGEAHSLFFDLSQSAFALGQLRNVRILARPLDVEVADFELSLSKITLESTTLSHAELAQRASEIRQSIAQEDAVPEAKKDYTIALGITGAVLLVSVVVAVIFIATYRAKRRRQNTM